MVVGANYLYLPEKLSKNRRGLVILFLGPSFYYKVWPAGLRMHLVHQLTIGGKHFLIYCFSMLGKVYSLLGKAREFLGLTVTGSLTANFVAQTYVEITKNSKIIFLQVVYNVVI